MHADTVVVPAVCTVDDIADVFRFVGDTKERRRHVYAMVRAGQLAPIGGVPAGKLTSSLRFSGRHVAALVDAEVAS